MKAAGEKGSKHKQVPHKHRSKLPNKQPPSPTMASHWNRLPADIQAMIEGMAYTAMMGDVMKFIPLLRCDDVQAVYMEALRNKDDVDKDRRSSKVFKVGMEVKYVKYNGDTRVGKIEKINRKYIDVLFCSRTEEEVKYFFRGKMLPSQLQMMA